MSACSRISAAHVVAEDRQRLEVVGRLDRRRAPLVVEHRQLAEDVAGPERRERDLAPVGVLADGARVAGAHDVAGVGVVALAEDGLAAVEARAARRPRRPLEVRGPELLEHGHPRRAARRSPRSCRHRAGIPRPARHRRARRCLHQTASSARSRRRRRAQRRAQPGQQREQRERQRATARAISATPAATSSTRSASCAASPGVQSSSAGGGARRCRRRPA